MRRKEPNSKLTTNYRAPGPLGSAPPGSLEVIRDTEGVSVTAYGIARPPSGQPTQVVVQFDGASLSIKASYQAKWHSPIDGCVSLPLNSDDPSGLLPILDGEKPWKAWPEIETLVRQALVDLQIPRRLLPVFDRHLIILRAVRNGPEVSETLRSIGSEKVRQKALFMLNEEHLEQRISGRLDVMRNLLDLDTRDPRIPSRFADTLRFHQELLNEKHRRVSLTLYDKMTQQLLRLEEEERTRSKMKGAISHHS